MANTTLYNVLAAGASCGILLVCSELLKPTPLLHVQHHPTVATASVDVQISQGSFAPLKNLVYRHNGLQCLTAKGYRVVSCDPGGIAKGEPILRLEGPPEFHTFAATCHECSVSTAFACDGAEPRTVPWERVLR